MSPSEATLSNNNKENNVKDLKQHSLPLTVITLGHLRIPIMYGQ